MTATFTCSIDDGYPSDLRIADLLSRHGLNATFYIPIKNREGYPVMSPTQIREIGSTFEIGSHTYDHCFLNSVSMSQARYQVMEGKKVLEDILGKDVSGFCYPGGKYRSEHIDLVKQAGFRYARTTTNLCFDAGKSRFEIPTTCQFYPHKKAVYLRNFVRSMHWNQRHAGLRVVLQKDSWFDRMTALLEHACQHESVFHLWLHSHNIDDLNLWSDLDTFFQQVAAQVDAKQRLNNAQFAARSFMPKPFIQHYQH
jgi:peptidoglycan/xylan/chitin deacetylase (PgdA/CDA1 family)